MVNGSTDLDHLMDNKGPYIHKIGYIYIYD